MNDVFFYSFSSVTDPLAVRHMNELFSIHHHISLVGEAWKFLYQVRQTWGNKKKSATTHVNAKMSYLHPSLPLAVVFSRQLLLINYVFRRHSV